MNSSNGITDSPVDIAAARLAETINAVVIDPREMVKAVVKRVAGFNYPNAQRAAQAAVVIASLEHPVRELIYQWNLSQLRKVLGDFERDARILAQPLPVITFAENLNAHHQRLNQLGWLGVEVDALKMFAQGGAGGNDSLVSYDVNSAIFKSGITATRAEIRDGLRPRWQPREEWEETQLFQQLREAHAASVAREQARKAESIVRYSSGPGRIIGRPAA